MNICCCFKIILIMNRDIYDIRDEYNLCCIYCNAIVDYINEKGLQSRFNSYVRTLVLYDGMYRSNKLSKYNQLELAIYDRGYNYYIYLSSIHKIV